MPRRLYLHLGLLIVWGPSSLAACNLLLGNEVGQWSDGGASSGTVIVPPDAFDAADGAPSADDGSVADAAPSGSCRPIAAPVHRCFDEGDCLVAGSFTPTYQGADGGITKAYPHDLALWGDYLYFAGQERTVEGRNNRGQGQLYRIDVALREPAKLVRPLSEPSPSAVAIRDGFLFWRTRDEGSGRTALHRLELARWQGDEPCSVAACGYERIAEDLAGQISELWPVSADEIYARVDGSLRRFRKEADTWSAAALLPSIMLTRGRLREGFWTGWSAGDAGDAGGQVALLVLRAGQTAQPQLAWPTPPAESSPIPFESSLLAAHCDETFLYEQWTTPQLRRVNLDAGLDATVDQMFSPIACANCDLDRLTFTHVSDARFSYLGRPNGNGLLAVPHEGGRTIRLADGDVWDVVVDDDAIYFTDVDGFSINRIAKR